MDVTALGWSLMAAIIPTLLYVTVLVLMDRNEREPWVLMVMVFAWGAVPAVMLSLMGEIVLSKSVGQIMRDYYPSPGAANLFNVAVVAPVVEELAKAMALLIVYWFAYKEFDGLMDGMLYGSLAGFGFAMSENTLYLNEQFHVSIQDGIALAFMRVVVFGMNHALFASMFGLGLGIARYSTSRIARVLWPLAGLVGAVGLHMFHNFSVSSPQMSPVLGLIVAWLGVGMWLYLVYFALQQEATWIREELAEEVAHGLLTMDEAKATTDLQWRAALTVTALRKRMERYAGQVVTLCTLAAKLAFKKRQFRIRGDEEGTLAEIDGLRAEIKAVRESLN
jgi:RsiW-degrading membrane proteinase PrsW (M82 family)